MIYSTLFSKDTYEDPKTSSIIGAILLLPDSLIFKIFNKACSPNIMPLNNGLISDFEFWPHWYDDTYNVNFVEPDVIIHCEYRDIIIEAKYGEKSGLYREQWQKEIIAYRNFYDYKKGLTLIAIGGNETYNAEKVEGVDIMKCSWTSLLMAVSSIRSQFESLSCNDEHINQILRILKFIEKSFEVHGVYNPIPLDVKPLTEFPSYSSNHSLLHFAL
ncbi:MAG: hypothetical protein K2K97_04435 [Muribaculaceae bacterium]|nr:hypothetical protein [Muribaculaceae bacterium]